MISLRTSSIVMGEVLETCLCFLSPKIVDGFFDVYLSAEQRHNLHDLFRNDETVIKVAPLPFLAK